MILNVAGFWDEHKDIQLSIFTAQGAASSIVRNAASARIQGLEFEAVARPVDALTINASLAVLDAKYKNYVDGGVDVSANRAFPHAPKLSASLGIDWRVVEGDWGKLNIYGDVNHVSKYYTFPYPLVTTAPSDQNAHATQSPGRTIVNMRLAVSDIAIGGAKASLSAFVRNLTNERSPSNFIDFGPASAACGWATSPIRGPGAQTVGIEF